MKSQVAQLRTELIENQALQQELLQLHIQAPTNAPPLETPKTPAAPETSTSNSNVDAAMNELAAIVPQYRASILALQGRIAILNKQLEQTTAERDHRERDAAAWRDASQRNEARFAEISATLHTQEAELSFSRQQHSMVEAELKKARFEAQQAVDSQQKLLETQSNTISRLETTVREQQEDIIAALDLVCHRSSGGGGATTKNTVGVDELHIDANLDFLDTLGISANPVITAKTTGATDDDDDDENWTIAAEKNLSSGGEDSLETWLHEPSFASKNPFPIKEKTSTAAEANKIKKLHKNKISKNAGSGSSSEMADLASDIAALRDALQLVL